MDFEFGSLLHLCQLIAASANPCMRVGLISSSENLDDDRHIQASGDILLCKDPVVHRVASVTYSGERVLEIIMSLIFGVHPNIFGGEKDDKADAI